MKVEVAVPGKLFIAGEYAIVQPGQLALVAGVNRFLTVGLEPVLEGQEGTIWSEQDPETVLTWRLEEGQVWVSQPEVYPLITTALQLVLDYGRAIGCQLSSPFHLKITSDLDDRETGRKYGLGSSGALTVALVRALLRYIKLEEKDLLVFKLAALVQTRLEMKGSFGDLAASSFAGLVAYQSVDRSWLTEEASRQSLHSLLESDWKDLDIQRLELPADVQFMAAWTGTVASTDASLDRVQKASGQWSQAGYDGFLRDSLACVKGLIHACKSDDRSAFLQGIRENRRLLKEASAVLGVEIETLALKTLIDRAEEVGAVAKTSGAGGGDCGIAFAGSVTIANKVKKNWLAAGLLPLDIEMCEVNKRDDVSARIWE
ncbi:TPA: phosphomevalonate kinase [Streptococcus suis]